MVERRRPRQTVVYKRLGALGIKTSSIAKRLGITNTGLRLWFDHGLRGDKARRVCDVIRFIFAELEKEIAKIETEIANRNRE